MKKKYSHALLQSFFDTPLPDSRSVSDGLMRHAFEVESVTEEAGETVYELDVMSDRYGDCLAHYGIAKELSAIFSLPMSRRYFTDRFVFAGHADCIRTEKCHRYAVLTVENISLRETPPAIVRVLSSVGQRSINPIVDLTNYLLLDIGQPVHAFDADKISGMLGVRQAREGESLVLLGGEEVSLTPEDTVITDDDRAVALAGVKGGEDTKTDADTRNVYIEVASFDARAVRATMQRLNLVSDAGVRFSQSLPPSFIDYTAHRAAELFGAHGEVTDSSDSFTGPPARFWGSGVSVSAVNDLLGTAYTKEDVRGALDRLSLPYEYIPARERFLEVAKEQVGKPYKWGSSVYRDAPAMFDCSSLVCYCATQAGLSVPRLSVNQYLSSAPVDKPRPGDLVFIHSSNPDVPKRTEAVFEAGCPVSPGTAPEGINHVGILAEDGQVIQAQGSFGANAVVMETVEEDRIIYAGSIFTGDTHRFAVTFPIERTDLRDEVDIIEEIGRILGYDTVPVREPSSVPVAPSVNPLLAKHLAAVDRLRPLGFSEIITYSFRKKGAVCVARPVAKDKGCLRADLRKGMEEALTLNAYNGELLGLPDIRVMEVGTVFTESGEETRLALGVTETLGRSPVDLKKIEEQVREVLPLPGGFEGSVWEVRLDDVPLEADAYALPPSVAGVSYMSPSPYPFILRDVSVFVPDGMGAAEVEGLLQEHGGAYLRRVNLFDAFSKDGRSSYAFRLVFQSDDGTLTDDVINERMETIYRALGERGCEVR